MIKRLRIKFIAIAFLAVLVILGLIVTIINVYNYSKIRNEADSRLQELYDGGGTYAYNRSRWNVVSNETGYQTGQTVYTSTLWNMIGYEREIVEPAFNPGSDPFANKNKDDIQRSIYVTFIRVKANNTLYRQTSSQNLTEESMFNMYKAVINSNNQKGYVDTNYRYLSLTNDEGDEFVLMMDYSVQISNARNFLVASLLISASGLLAFLASIIIASYFIFRPVEESYVKQKRFIANAAHELKTPLTIISANNEVEELIVGKNEQTEAINKQVLKLTGMVNSLTKLALLEENYKLEKTEKFSLDDAVIDVYKTYEQKLKERHLILKENVAKDVIYDGDEGLIRVLVSILIDNAFKYSLTFIEVSLKKDNDKIILEVSNDSSDLEDGMHPELFERFYRTNEKRASNIQGSGIGLSIAKEIVILHKGKIIAEALKGVYKIKVIL